MSNLSLRLPLNSCPRTTCYIKGEKWGLYGVMVAFVHFWFGNTNEEQRVLFTMWDTPFLFLRHLQLTRQWIDCASDNRLIFKKAKHEAALPSHIFFLNVFINLPSVWVYRSPQRKKYCRGPILAYWPRELSAHEFLLKRKKTNNNLQSVNQFVRLGDYFQVSEQKKINNRKKGGEAAISERDEPQLHSSPSSPRAHSGPSTLRHVGGNFCSRQLQTSPTPPRHSGCCCSLRAACVLFHLADRIF